VLRYYIRRVENRDGNHSRRKPWRVATGTPLTLKSALLLKGLRLRTRFRCSKSGNRPHVLRVESWLFITYAAFTKVEDRDAAL
jgi:hypothetical protein